MGAAPKIKAEFPDEVFLAEAIRDDRAVERELSMKAIGKPDMSLQCRVKSIDMDHVRCLDAIYRSEKQISRIVVFFDGKVYRIADGFHRHEMHRIAKLPSIRAYVIKGGYAEALTYSTMSNQRALLRRTKEDEQSALEKLLADPEWTKKSTFALAKHVGINSGRAEKYRVAYYERTGEKYPDTVEASNGAKMPRGMTFKAAYKGIIPKMRSKDNHGADSKVANVNGYRTYLSQDDDSSEKKLADKVAEVQARKKLFSTSEIKRWLLCHKVATQTIESLSLGRSIQFPGMSGFFVRDVTCTSVVFDDNDAAANSVGSVILLSAARGNMSCRKVVLCDPEFGPANLIALAAKAGVEFITPEAFVESLKGDGESTDGAADA